MSAEMLQNLLHNLIAETEQDLFKIIIADWWQKSSKICATQFDIRLVAEIEQDLRNEI